MSLMNFLEKKFRFEASHQLRGLPETHQCSRIHGHSYGLTVTIRSTGLDPSIPWIVDAALVGKIVKPTIEKMFDHHMLNSTLGVSNPTAEYIANWWWKFLQDEMLRLNKMAGVSEKDYTSGSESAIYLHRVHIQETDTTAAWVENSP
jgi:6-pyruvoyltetrahydropterin/6-carboxytetrahydropterin synthase